MATPETLEMLAEMTPMRAGICFPATGSNLPKGMDGDLDGDLYMLLRNEWWLYSKQSEWSKQPRWGAPGAVPFAGRQKRKWHPQGLGPIDQNICQII